MEETTSLLATVAVWAVLGGVCFLGFSLVYLGLLTVCNAHSNSDNWRKIAHDLERECECLHRQVEQLVKELNEVNRYRRYR